MFIVNELGRGCAILAQELGDRAVEAAGEQTLMRRVMTAFPCVRPGCLNVPAGVDDIPSATPFARRSPLSSL
jgi:hypothetical protein